MHEYNIYLGGKRSKQARGIIEATIQPLAFILTAALWASVSIIALVHIVALTLPPWYCLLKSDKLILFKV